MLLRDEILALRPVEPPAPALGGVPKVFAFFGGTDAFGAGPYVVQALAATGVPFEATVVAPGETWRRRSAPSTSGTGQQVKVIGPTTQLAAAVWRPTWSSVRPVRRPGSCSVSVRPPGLVCVVDNQMMGYERAVATGTAVGVGVLSELKTDPSTAAAVLRPLLTDPAERARIAAAGWKLVDGQRPRPGRRRATRLT